MSLKNIVNRMNKPGSGYTKHNLRGPTKTTLSRKDFNSDAEYEAERYKVRVEMAGESLYKTYMARDPDVMFNEYVRNAKRRGLSFEITKKEFMTFWQQPCYYCGSEIENVGLDRVDSRIGYLIDNVVPCCHICNQGKLNRPQSMFLEYLKRVYQYQADRKNKW